APGEEALRQPRGAPAAPVGGEPRGRDTAACIGLGAALISRRDPDATMIVMPADHAIEPDQEFRRAVHAAAQLTDEFPDALVTFGISPSYAATGYGYIRRSEPVAQRQGIAAFKVREFREKPRAEVAAQYVAAGDYYWNSGIFVWKSAAVLGELNRLKPGIHDAVQRIAAAWETPTREAVFRAEYAQTEKISIDFAVMEKAGRVLVVQAPYHWDDVGSWLALERRNPQDANGNTVQALHIGINTANCVIVSDPGRLIATIGVSNP